MFGIENNRAINLSATLLCLGIIIGSIYGLAKASIEINSNKYLFYKLYNLILLDIQENLTTYALFGLLIAITIIIISVLLILASNRILCMIARLNLSTKSKINLLIYSSLIVSIILVFSYLYYLEIILLLKSTNATSWLAAFSSSQKDTSLIFTVIAIIMSTYLIALFCSIVWQSFMGNILRVVLDRINTHFIKQFGLFTIITILSLNLFVFGYKEATSSEGPNIIVIVIDTLRADRLGTYGHNRNASPNIDKLAEKSVLFENAISQAPWTLPSIASIFSGLYPSYIGTKHINSNVKYGILTLSEYMKNNYYNTVAVISNIVVSKSFGFAQGFNTFNQEHIAKVDQISSEIITKQAIEYLSQIKNQKFFLWIHYFDPHHNYKDHSEYSYSDGYSGILPKDLDNKKLNKINASLNENDLKYIKDVYDEEISYTDKHIGVLIDSLDELGLMDNTIIVLTSDHGEEFMERTRIGHGSSLYKELIHVPLIIYNPFDIDKMGKRISKHVEIRNIPKTITTLAGLEENIFEGINLLDDEKMKLDHIVLSENYGFIDKTRTEAIIYKDWKLINIVENQVTELYKVDSDTNETNDLFTKDEKEINVQKEKLQTILARILNNDVEDFNETELSKEDIKQLKALGYLQ